MEERITIRIVRDFAEKQKTRPLYERVFDDPPEFVDYYYREKCADNTMVLLEDDGRIVSMLHLNPYRVFVCGKVCDSYYVVAVATDQAYRRRGYMARLLRASFDLMRAERIPFCFLLPVDRAIYEWIGFRVISDFYVRRPSHPGERGRLPYETVRRSYDVYCVRDDVYLRRLAMEEEFDADDGGEELPANPVMMAKITDPVSFAALTGLSEDTTEEEMTGFLQRKKCYFSEEV